ncbi:MAG: sodium:solute symporter family protein [Thermoguttaceae bacterium]
MTFPIILTLLFFVLLIGISIWWSRQNESVNDFFLGGKTLGPWILAISYGTAYFSAVIFVGFAGKFGWQFGFGSLWVGVGNAIIGGLLAWILLGKRTRRMTHNLNTMTMPEFFAARYESNGLKVISAIIIFFFLTPYSASVYKGLSYLFQITLENKIGFTPVLTTIMVVSLLYVSLGGYKAVARIDFVLGIIMFFGSLLMVFFVVRSFGGFANVIQEVPEKLAARMEMQGTAESVTPSPWYVLPSVIFMTSFGVWGLPQMVHKYYAIRDEKQILRGAVITTVFALVIGCAAYFVGATSHLLDFNNISLKQVPGGEIVDFDKLVPDLLMSHLPQVLMGVILLLVLSASLSTLSSLVLVSASAITIDLYKGYVKPNASDKESMWLMRVLCAVFILFSYLIALLDPGWIVTLMSISWGAVAGSFLAPYLYGLYWRGTTRCGALAGVWVGLLVSNGMFSYWIFTYGLQKAASLATVAASLAMIIPMFVVPVVSVFTKPPKKETIEQAFKQ